MRRRRILFRANHRGTHENDLLVGGYVTPRIATFSDAELAAVEAVLELPDPELADWLTGRRPIPPEADTPMLRAMHADARRHDTDARQRDIDGGRHDADGCRHDPDAPPQHPGAPRHAASRPGVALDAVAGEPRADGLRSADH